MCSREIFTKKCRQQQIFDSDLKGAWHNNYVTFTPIAKNFMLYCRLIYMLSILCVRLTIKIKVRIPESFKVGWYPPPQKKKLGRVTLTYRPRLRSSRKRKQSGIPAKIRRWSTIHGVFRNPRIRSLYGKNPQSVRFLRQNSSIRKHIHPPHYQSGAFPLLEMRKTIPWSHNMAALNSPEGILADFLIRIFSSLPSLLCPPFVNTKPKKTSRNHCAQDHGVEHGGGIHAEERFYFRYTWQLRLVSGSLGHHQRFILHRFFYHGSNFNLSIFIGFCTRQM